MRFNKEKALWDYLGSSEIFLLTGEQREIYETMLELRGDDSPIQLEDIAKAVYRSPSGTHRFMSKLIDMGFVQKEGHGLYRVIKKTSSENQYENVNFWEMFNDFI